MSELLASLNELPEEPFVGIATPELVFVGVPNRAEFDKINLPPREINGDTGHLIVKRLEGDSVTVIFQHWLPLKALGATR